MSKLAFKHFVHIICHIIPNNSCHINYKYMTSTIPLAIGCHPHQRIEKTSIHTKVCYKNKVKCALVLGDIKINLLVLVVNDLSRYTGI